VFFVQQSRGSADEVHRSSRARKKALRMTSSRQGWKLKPEAWLRGQSAEILTRQQEGAQDDKKLGLCLVEND
jgi:hypothetical protein